MDRKPRAARSKPFTCSLLLLAACAAAPPPRPAAATGPPGSSADNPIRVERMTEEVDQIQSRPCPGGGHWQMGEQVSRVAPQENGCMLDKFTVHCTTSPEVGTMWFLHCM